MKKGKLIGRIFGIALIFAMTGVVLGIVENYIRNDNVFAFELEPMRAWSKTQKTQMGVSHVS